MPDEKILWEECISETIEIELPEVARLQISTCVRLVSSDENFQIEVEAFNR